MGVPKGFPLGLDGLLKPPAICPVCGALFIATHERPDKKTVYRHNETDVCAAP